LIIELRLQIYQHLLIPEAPLSLVRPPPSPESKDKDNTHKNKDVVDSDEDDWIDDSDYDSDSSGKISPSLLDTFRDEDGTFVYKGMDFHELENAYHANTLSTEEGRIFEAMELRQLIEEVISEDEDEDEDAEDIPRRSGRDLAILRTNRQIYNEASALFYAESTVLIEIDDLLDLAQQRPAHIVGRWQFAWMDTWSHHPISNPGKQLSNGNYNYRPNPIPVVMQTSQDRRHHPWTDRRVIHSHTTRIPVSPNGKLFPHVFSRFQNIQLNATFEEDYVQHNAMWIDDETFDIRPSDAEKFLKHVSKVDFYVLLYVLTLLLQVKTLKVITDFVKLLSHSPKINLTIILEAVIEVQSKFLNGMDDETDDGSDLSDLDDESAHKERLTQIEKEDKILDMANQRAVELLVDSTLFNPLKRLANVRKFNIQFGGSRDMIGNQASQIAPSPKYGCIFAKMKDIIEGHFQERDA